ETLAPTLVKVTRPSPIAYDSRRLTRNTPPETWTHCNSLSSQRDVMPCIWGGDLVVVARLRAAWVARLCCGSPGTGVSGVAMFESSNAIARRANRPDAELLLTHNRSTA